MEINFKKAGTWLLDKSATIILTIVIAALIKVCVAGFEEVHVIYNDFQAMKSNTQVDIIAHRQIQVKDSLLAVYEDSINNRLLTIEGTMQAHQEKIGELSANILFK